MTPAPAAWPARIVVISPHLDDAVFGCGDLLAAQPGSVVVTVLAGDPDGRVGLTDWDARAGFPSSRAVMRARRQEDREALGLLSAVPVWLAFQDSQYPTTPPRAELVRAVVDTLVEFRAATVLIPLGLWHSDHKMVHDVAMEAVRSRERLKVVLYADAIYRVFAGSEITDRLSVLSRDGFEIGDIPPPSSVSASFGKRKAIERYRSQLRALSSEGRPGWEDALRPEQYWHLTQPVRGAAPLTGEDAARFATRMRSHRGEGP
jgi:LmbE family N-acetylglucosaminyl deacetylase